MPTSIKKKSAEKGTKAPDSSKMRKGRTAPPRSLLIPIPKEPRLGATKGDEDYECTSDMAVNDGLDTDTISYIRGYDRASEIFWFE
jgi:hypothetical protein